MCFFVLLRKIGLVIDCLLIGLIASAQSHEFQFIPINEVVIEQQGFVGKLGSHFFLMNRENTGLLSLYVYDSVSQTGIIRNYPFQKQPMSVLIYDKSILFISAIPDKTETAYYFLEVDEEGNLLRRKEGKLPNLKEAVRIINSTNKKHILFYQYLNKSFDSILISGTLMGSNGELIKQLNYSFKKDSELDAEPELFLDNNGNTHILVFDVYSNYRLSSDLTVNTIPFVEEQIVSETFTFEKIKLKNLRVFQNNECNCMQVEGLYVNGSGKNNKGIYSIAFPFGRKNELAPRFIPFSLEIIKNFKRGFSATEESILNSIQLQEIIYSDLGSFAILALNNGIPQQTSVNRPENDLSFKSFNRNLNVSRALDFQPPTTTTSSSTATGSNNPRTRIVAGNFDKYSNAAPIVPGMPEKSSPLSSSASGRNAPKLICIKLDTEKGFQWYTSRSLDVFNTGRDIYNRILLIGGEKETILFVLYQADVLAEPYPVLVTMKAGKQLLEKFPEKKLIFSPIQFLNHSQYVSIYQNKETGVGGLMFIHSKE